MLGNILLALVIVAIIGGALAKMMIDKRNGVKCSGCPYGKIATGGCDCPIPKKKDSGGSKL